MFNVLIVQQILPPYPIRNMGRICVMIMMLFLILASVQVCGFYFQAVFVGIGSFLDIVSVLDYKVS